MAGSPVQGRSKKRLYEAPAALWPVVAYLSAIVAANLLVARFGAWITIPNAIVLVGLDLSLRDRLHEAWHGRGLVWKMGALIATGGAISYLVNADAGRIALASTIAFVAAAIADSLVFGGLRARGASWLGAAQGSNVVSAGVDSILFPTIAFGELLPLIVAGQFLAKVGGGYLWARWLESRHAPPRT